MRRREPWSRVEDLPPGNPRLKREIAKRHLPQVMTVASGENVLTHGAMEVLNLCLNVVARPVMRRHCAKSQRTQQLAADNRAPERLTSI